MSCHAINHERFESRHACAVILLLVLCAAALPAVAAWENTDYTGVIEPGRLAEFVSVCSDGEGGMLVAAHDSNHTHKIKVSRISHTGDELWGNGGVTVPASGGGTYRWGPMAVAADGNGGAYVAYSEGASGGPHLLYLAHFWSDGAYDWATQAGDFGIYDPDLKVEAVETDTGAVILVWTYAHAYLPHLLLSARYGIDQGLDWTAQVGDNISLDPDPSSWSAASDGALGLLVAFDRQPSPSPDEQRVQRISSTGIVEWGVNGVEIWNYSDAFVDVIHADSGGGALVMVQNDLSEAWVQQVNAGGTETWAAGGVQVFNSAGYFSHSSVMCADGAGGLILVAGIWDLYAQRVDASGSLLWNGGALNGVAITSPLSIQHSPTICVDGSGGATVVFLDDMYCDLVDPKNYVLAAARIDSGGEPEYGGEILWASGGADGYMPVSPMAIDDASRGALVAWQEFTNGMGANDVRALGVDRDGAVPPVPYLTRVFTDYAYPTGLQPHFVIGGYLEMTQTFELHQAGQTPISMVPQNIALVDVATTYMTPVDAAEGAWDLVLSHGGAPVDTLVNAIGIGEPPPCDVDEFLGTPGSQPSNSGSLRKADFDSWGNAYMVYLVYEESTYRIYRHVITAGDMTTDMIHEVTDGSTPSGLSFAIGPDDVQHLVFSAQVDASNTRLRHLRFDSDGILLGEATHMFPGPPTAEPVVAVTNFDEVIVVVEYEPTPSVVTLGFLVCNGGTIVGPYNTFAGTNARFPDLTPYGNDGLMMTYVRDSVPAGETEVCYCEYDGFAWLAPGVIHTGLYAMSPSVAWGGDDVLLFAWIVDNVSGEPRPYTCRMGGGVPGPVFLRSGYENTYSTSVAAAGHERFLLQILDTDTGVPMRINLRYGNGNVFYPDRRINSTDDVDLPLLAAARDGSGILSFWDNYTPLGSPIGYYWCRTGWPAPVPDADRGILALQTYPNPFNPRTTLAFELPAAGRAKLSLYDLGGRHVRTLVDGELVAGMHERTWDGCDGRGRRQASGVFLARLELPGQVEVQVSKVTLVK